MKKIIVLLSILVLFVTGCSMSKLDSTNISKNMKILLSQKNVLYNVYFDGYKYYVPRGMRFKNKEEYNALLYDRDGNQYYLYVDAISYYHKIKNTYKVSPNSHYSERISYQHKTGYIQIDEVDDQYFVQFVFNYAKIESYVSKEKLVSAVNYMCYILRSIEFNDKVLESLIGENVLNYKEENFSLFKADSSKEDFLDVVDKYEDKDYKKDTDPEEFELDEG